MKINSINSFNYQTKNNYNQKNQQSFGHKIILDVGASNPKGTLKVSVQSDNGDFLFKKSGYVNTTVDGFENSKDFVQKIGQIVKDTHAETIQRADAGEFKLGKNDRKLSGVGLFVPGTTYTQGKNDLIAFMPNLRDKQGNSLLNADFRSYERTLKTKPEEETGINVNKNKFEFIATKDLGGTGLGIAKVLGQRGELKEGDYIMGIMTGGGFGSVDIKVKGDNVEIETSESSSYLTASPNGGHLNKLGRLGVSVKSHIGHFCDALALPELADGTELRKAMIAAGDARIVEDNEMNISNSDKELIDVVAKSNLFKVIKETPEKTVFAFKDDDPDFRQKLVDARISAVKDYAEAISLISINKINDCMNKIILVGPFAHGINRWMKENPGLFSTEKEEIKDLPDLIKKEVRSRITDVDLPSTDKLTKLYNFDVICDKDINIKDNTFAGDFLLNPDLKFTGNRGSWFSIPLKEIQPKKK